MNIAIILSIGTLGVRGEFMVSLDAAAEILPTETATAGPSGRLSASYMFLGSLGVQGYTGCGYFPKREVGETSGTHLNSVIASRQLRCQIGAGLIMQTGERKTGFEAFAGVAYALIYDFERDWLTAEDLLIDQRGAGEQHGLVANIRIGGYHRFSHRWQITFGGEGTVPLVGPSGNASAGVYLGIRAGFFP